ncbi:hypothetical protein [Thalassomonas sp. M1454]|uniref:hypothetical protein n=1 Tax=Thalassomonas sp. M1454 TaxID=2594477 RepID=UPI00117D06FB|nr:hypothetical protein [Thalassomonas sp. M1454]TRX55771.1 hypothetical protein FNN08_09095 [Thalassomonas sp. M1454]
MRTLSKSLIALVSCAMVQGTVQAEEWQFEFTPYIWAAANEGSSGPILTLADGTEVPLDAPVDISFGDLAEKLDFGTMFNFSATKGKWLAYSEITVLNVPETKIASATTPTRFGDINTDINIEIGGEIVDLAVGYQLMARDNFDLYGYVGARYFNLEVTLDLDSGDSVILNASGTTGDEFIDPLVGLHGKWRINDTFTLQGRVEVGGFDDQPSENTLVNVTLDHKLNDKWSLKYFYRVMNIDYQDNGFIYDMEVTGPGIGASYIF